MSSASFGSKNYAGLDGQPAIKDTFNTNDPTKDYSFMDVVVVRYQEIDGTASFGKGEEMLALVTSAKDGRLTLRPKDSSFREFKIDVTDSTQIERPASDDDKLHLRVRKKTREGSIEAAQKSIQESHKANMFGSKKPAGDDPTPLT